MAAIRRENANIAEFPGKPLSIEIDMVPFVKLPKLPGAVAR
jgi:hypothetical protein